MLSPTNNIEALGSALAGVHPGSHASTGFDLASLAVVTKDVQDQLAASHHTQQHKVSADVGAIHAWTATETMGLGKLV